MPKLTQRERRLKNATSGLEGGIRFAAITQREQLKLPCNHTFHGACMCKWGNIGNPSGVADIILPSGSKPKIALFKRI
jgi:hypothetical protein